MSETRLHRTIDTERGPIQVAINRRGCKGEWTQASDDALAALVRAIASDPRFRSPAEASVESPSPSELP